MFSVAPVGGVRCTHAQFPGGSDGKASARNAGDLGSIPGLGRSPGEGNGHPLQSSCLENSMDGGAWWATVHGVTKSRTRLSDFTFFSFFLLSGHSLQEVVLLGDHMRVPVSANASLPLANADREVIYPRPEQIEHHAEGR